MRNNNNIIEKEYLKLISLGFKIINKEMRPWGGFFVIDESQSQKFADRYFDGRDVKYLRITTKISPKILIVSPKSKLSWQYHKRRAEIWKVVKGKIGVTKSINDIENDPLEYNDGDIITLGQGERHRLIGLDDYGIIAEIWQHTDPNNPSDEDDIIRISDDYGR